jgi:hypothetical protein
MISIQTVFVRDVGAKHRKAATSKIEQKMVSRLILLLSIFFNCAPSAVP